VRNNGKGAPSADFFVQSAHTFIDPFKRRSRRLQQKIHDISIQTIYYSTSFLNLQEISLPHFIFTHFSQNNSKKSFEKKLFFCKKGLDTRKALCYNVQAFGVTPLKRLEFI
jgi:hypothetical protein